MTVQLTGTWSARCTVDLVVAIVYAAVGVLAANTPAVTPARKVPRR